MRTPERQTLIALSASLLLHGTLLFLGARYAGRLSSDSRASAAPIQPAPVETRLFVDPPPLPPLKPRLDPIVITPPALPPKPVLPKDPPPPPPLASLPIISPKLLPPPPPPVLRQADGFGELTGTPDATALHSFAGDKPMQAPKAEHDQPSISRDPAGPKRSPQKPAKSNPGDIDQEGKKANPGQAPTGLTAIAPATPAKPSSPEKPQPPQRPSPTSPLNPQPLTQPPAPAPAPAPRSNDEFGPLAQASLAKPVPSPQLASATPQPAPLPDAPPAPSNPTPPSGPLAGQPDAASATASQPDDAPLSDSDSDAFSITGSAELVRGRVQAHFGRKVKTVRPVLQLAGRYDTISSAPMVLLQVRTDDTGKVREVKVLKSSGSNEIDQPCYLAMYEWWFEPPRDKHGKPQPAEMLWTITIRSL